MIRLLIPLMMFAGPLAAHVGPQPHTHNGDPIWVIALLGVLAVGGAAMFKRGR